MKAMLTMLTALGLILLLTSPVMAGDGDFAKVEVRPDTATYALDTFVCRVFTQTCIVTYRKVDGSGDAVGEEISYRFWRTTINLQIN